MKLSFVADKDGELARLDSRRKREQGVFEISEPNELLFTPVAKEVISKVTMGMVVDFRPPLYSVVWSNGEEELFNKKELDFFRRVHSKHELMARNREKARQSRGKPPPRKKMGMGGKDIILPHEMIEPVALEVELNPERDRSALEWRFLEVAAAQRAEAANGPSMASILAAATGQANEEEEEEANSNGASIQIRNCPHLRAGREPPQALWCAVGGNVGDLSLINCGRKHAPPAGLYFLVNLRYTLLLRGELSRRPQAHRMT